MENNNNKTSEIVPVKVTKRINPRPKTARAANNAPGKESQSKTNNKRYHKRRPRKNLPTANGYRNNNRSHKPSIGEKLVNTLSALVGKSLKTIIPWAILSTLVFTYGAYAIFYTVTLDSTLPMWYVVFLAIVLFGTFALFGLVYGVCMALLYTVKYFSESIGSIVRESINRIKNSIESKVDNFADSLSKNEVMEIIKTTFEDLNRNIRRYAANTAAGIIAVSALAGIVYVTKNALIKSARSIRNKADFFAMLSAKTALVAAIILNLTFFTKIVIWLGYVLGLFVVLAQVIAVLLIK